jgi:phytoene/squalene synthetase
VAVTEALYYFIGHDDPSPNHQARYLAVTGAHIVHMLRDAVEDVEAGYFNIPREVLQARGISPQDIASGPTANGFARNSTWRARISTFRANALRGSRTGAAAWPGMPTPPASVDAERHRTRQFCLRAEYPERKGLAAGLWMSWH